MPSLVGGEVSPIIFVVSRGVLLDWWPVEKCLFTLVANLGVSPYFVGNREIPSFISDS